MLVKAFIDNRSHPDAQQKFDRDLRIVCEEIIPAAFHSDDAPKRPGEITWVPQHFVCAGTRVNAVLEITFDPTWELSNVTERAESVRNALKGLAPEWVIDVVAIPAQAGWASSLTERRGTDPAPDEGMTMDDAIRRAMLKLVSSS